MMEKTGFCEICRADVPCILKTEQTVGSLGGKHFEYRRTEAYCPNCGAYVSLHGLDDLNLDALYAAYKKSNS